MGRGSWVFLSRAHAAGLQDESGSEVLHLVVAQLVNSGTVKSRREEANVDAIETGVILLRRCSARSGRREYSEASQRQTGAGQDYK